MAKVPDLILCVDIGSTCIKAAQFFSSPNGDLVLEKFAYQEFTSDSEDTDDVDSLLHALSELIVSNQFDARATYVSVSGQSSFTRFIKVPAVSADKNKSREIIGYEAKQAIPFPLDEVVWDSQIISAGDDADVSEYDVLLAILKNEVAYPLVDCIDNIGNEIRGIEVSATAAYNAARANNVGSEQCEMMLNIGGKFSSLIFIDGSNIFIRSIPIAGLTITQQIAKEFNISIPEAEELKRRHGFVALGGAYEEPDSEVAATVSKIVRNVMTRLHAEINRSINIYRASQGGRKPEKLYLSGGSSILAFTPRFFSEKLRIPVEYFNPFQVVTLDENIDQELLRDTAHLFSELIGLALNHIGHTPLAISLIPEPVRKQQLFKIKRPYFYATCIALLVYLGITYWTLVNQSADIQMKQQKIERELTAKRKVSSSVQNAYNNFKSLEGEYSKITDMLKYRENWIVFFDRFQKLVPDNIWFSKISIDTKAKVERASAVKKKEETEVAPDPGMARGGFNFGAPDPTMAAQKKEELIPAKKWLNMEGYIFIEKGRDVKLQEANHAASRFSSGLQTSELFIETDPNLIQDDSIYDYNITEFRYSIELQKPINSKAFTDLIRKKAGDKSQQGKKD